MELKKSSENKVELKMMDDEDEVVDDVEKVGKSDEDEEQYEMENDIENDEDIELEKVEMIVENGMVEKEAEYDSNEVAVAPDKEIGKDEVHDIVNDMEPEDDSANVEGKPARKSYENELDDPKYDKYDMIEEDKIAEKDEEKVEVEMSKEINEIRRKLNAKYEDRVYGGTDEKQGEYDKMWKEIDKIVVVLKENEEEWTNGTKEEKEKVRKKEMEERLRRAAEKKRRYGSKLGKESKGEKRESEERIKRKIALIEIKKNLWRSYRVGKQSIMLSEYLTEGKRTKEKREEEERKKEKQRKALILKDSWISVKVLLDEMEMNGENWEEMEEGKDIGEEERKGKKRKKEEKRGNK